MARKARVEFPDAIYHVMMRGNEKNRIFYGSKDYELFLEALSQGLERFGVECNAYCLMPNHVHMAITTPRANLSKFMAWLQTTFTVRYNRDHKRSGHLFQGRYRAEVVDQGDYGRWLVLYIHLNPIRSRVKDSLRYTRGIEELNRFPWSSHFDYAGLRLSRKELNLDWLGEWSQRLPQAHRAYQKDVQRQIGSKDPLDWKSYVKMGLVAGDEELSAKVQKLLSKKGKEVGREASRKLGKTERAKRLSKVLKEEEDPRNRIWIRLKLLGESQVALAKELGYGSSMAIHQIAKRMESRSGKDALLKKKIQTWKKIVFNVDD